MEEENCVDDVDDIFSIDWSETASMSPESINENSFNLWKFPSYKEYFHFIRERYSPEVSNQHSNQHSPEKADILSQPATPSYGNTPKKCIDKFTKQPCRVDTNKRANNEPDSCEVNDGTVHTNYHMSMKEPRKTRVIYKEKRFYHLCMQNKCNMSEEKRFEKMKELMTRIHSEQIEYQQFLHHSASNNMKKYLYLNDAVKDCVVNNIKDSITKLKESTQKVFKMSQQINLEHLPVPKNPFLTFVRRVHEEGTVPKYNLPEIGTQLTFDATSLTSSKGNHLSEDTILTLCKSESVEFYMKSAALIAIMEGLAVNTREWLVPLEVKEVEIGKEDKRKVLMIGDPLPRRVISTREVNNVYYERTLKRFMKNNQVSSKADRKRPENTCEEELGIPGEDLVIDIDENDDEGIVEKPSEGEPNIHVNLFSLGDLNLLLETTTHQHDTTSQKTFQFSPKCEYQYVVGLEQFSLLELCQLFWSSHIANTDWIVCSRVDIWNDVIVRNDTYTRDILCPPACPYQPRHFCNPLYYMLNELRSLKPGAYILEHAVGETCIKIFQDHDGDVTYDVIYDNKEELIVELVSPWLPIDTTILTNCAIEKTWIPGLFSQFQQWRSPNKIKNKNKKQRGKMFNNKWCSGVKQDVRVEPETPIVPHSNVVSSRILTSYGDEEF